MKKYAVFLDLETSGLNPFRNSILEFYGQRGLDKLHLYFKPRDGSITSDEALRVNGLELSKLERDGVSLREGMTLVGKFLKDNSVIIGWNIKFDLDFLATHFSFAEIPFAKQLYYLDLLEVYRAKVKPTLQDAPSSDRLDVVAPYFGISVNFHSAQSDVFAVKLLFVKFLEYGVLYKDFIYDYSHTFWEYWELARKINQKVVV